MSNAASSAPSADDVFSGARFLEYLKRFEIEPSSVTRFEDFAVIGYGTKTVTIYSFRMPTEESNAKAAFYTRGRVCVSDGEYFPTSNWQR